MPPLLFLRLSMLAAIAQPFEGHWQGNTEVLGRQVSLSLQLFRNGKKLSGFCQDSKVTFFVEGSIESNTKAFIKCNQTRYRLVLIGSKLKLTQGEFVCLMSKRNRNTNNLLGGKGKPSNEAPTKLKSPNRSREGLSAIIK